MNTQIRPSTATVQAPTEARVLVFSTLFPNKSQPSAGLFIRERMFRVAEHLPLIVVSPKPWFPLQSLIQRFKPGYRPTPGHKEVQQQIEVYFPRFLSFPVVFRSLDGLSMALCSWLLLRKLKKQFSYNVIDSHFAYPDGYAATVNVNSFQINNDINATYNAQINSKIISTTIVIAVRITTHKVFFSCR